MEPGERHVRRGNRKHHGEQEQEQRSYVRGDGARRPEGDSEQDYPYGGQYARRVRPKWRGQQSNRDRGYEHSENLGGAEPCIHRKVYSARNYSAVIGGVVRAKGEVIRQSSNRYNDTRGSVFPRMLPRCLAVRAFDFWMIGNNYRKV